MAKRTSSNPSERAAPDRRQVLGALAGAALLGCGKRPDPTAIRKLPLRNSPGWRAGEERSVPSTCTLCEAGCGIRVRVVEGRAVKIEGNPEHPVNHGGLCSRGQAGLQLLYAADRVLSPLRRVGARGAGQWQPISWDEALAELAGKLAALRDAGHPERLVLLDGDGTRLVPELWTRLLDAYGSRNHVRLSSPRAGMDLAAATMGKGRPAYDFENARVLLLLGEDSLAASGQALRLWQAASAPAEHGPGRRLHIVCVSSRRPQVRVDEWIPILPGGQGALALSLAQVLLRERLFDRAFVEAHVVDSLAGRVLGTPDDEKERIERSGLRWIEAEFAPEKTVTSTGLEPATVERLARRLAKQRPALVLGGAEVGGASNGVASSMAVLTLNALLGNVGQPGGVLWQERPRLADWTGGSGDEDRRQSLQHPRIDRAGGHCPLGKHRAHALPEAILAGQPYPVEILLVRRVDPLSRLPAPKAWRAAIEKLPWLVSFSSHLDRTTMLADLVLPEPTALETWDVVEPAPASGEPILGLCQPVVAPVHDTRPAGDVVLALAEKFGGSVRQALPWPSYKDAVKIRLQGLAQAEHNQHIDTLLGSMRDKGGWWRDREDEGAADPGEIEVASMRIFMRTQGPKGRNGQTSRLSRAWPVEGMPPWEPARFAGAAEAFPFLLFVFRPTSMIEESADVAWLRELPPEVGTPASPRVEMHPEDADHLDLAEGDALTVTSPAGSCAARLHITEGVRPGVVAMALGPVEVLDLLVPDEDRLAGLLAWQGTRVRVGRTS